MDAPPAELASSRAPEPSARANGLPSQAASRMERMGALVVSLASFAFRAPALLNAWQTNSDAAVVGLQAMHVLRGEWSPFLWGSGYQTSVDATIAALFFAVLGPSPLALMLSSLVLHLVLTLLAFDIVRRRTAASPSGPWLAVLLVLPLVFTSSPSHTYILYPPRQAALTLAVASFWLFDRASDAGRRSPLVFALGGAALGLACFADPYALVLVPPVVLFALLCAWTRGDLPRTARAIASSLAGGFVGLVPALFLWASPRASHGQVGLTAAVVAHNAELLVESCLPWAVGAKVYFARHAMDYAPWEVSPLVRALQYGGGASLLALVITGGALAATRRFSWEARRLGLAGSAALPITIAGFLGSVMVMDIFSARYLAAIFLMVPFALVPVAILLGARRFAIVLGPYVVVAAVAGWVGYGPFVSGPLPVHVEPGVTNDERVVAALRDRDVRFAEADYWVSYRLTFLSREALVVVPTNRAEDRYPPYRADFESARRVAHLFDPERSREAAGSFRARVIAGDTPFERTFEELTVGGITALVLRRRDESTSIP